MKLRCAMICCLLPAMPAAAAILFDQCVNVAEAPSFWYHKQETSNTIVCAFNEAQGVHISNGVLHVQHLNKWDDTTNLVAIAVTNGVIDSHMVYFQMSDSKERRTVVAEIAFDQPIIGFLADNELFEKTNPLFAPNPTHKKAVNCPKWSLEEKLSWTELDNVTTLSPTRIRIEWTNHSATDPLRVLTLRPAGVITNEP